MEYGEKIWMKARPKTVRANLKFCISMSDDKVLSILPTPFNFVDYKALFFFFWTDAKLSLWLSLASIP